MLNKLLPTILTSLIFLGLFLGLSDILLIDNSFNLIFERDSTESIILWELRLPRLFTAILVGASLALAGCLSQYLFNNPLADPYILGTASGASLGANLLPLFLPIGLLSTTLGAWLGAVVITGITLLISFKNKHIQVYKLLLNGMAMSSFAAAVISFLIFTTSSDQQLRQIIFWVIGSFERAQWIQIPFLAIVLLLTLVYLYYKHNALTLLLIGEEQAKVMGLNTNMLKITLLLFLTLLVSFSVACAGPIGFVGIVIPHIARSINSKLNYNYYVISSLLGACLLLFGEIISRPIYPPSGLPIGVLTSFIGVPFFVYLINKGK